MSKLKKQRLSALHKELKPGERVEATGEFSAARGVCIFFAVALLSFAAGRIFASRIVVLMLTNLLSMWMMVDAARALFTAQNSCVLVTDRRVFGSAGEKPFSLTHRQIKQIYERSGLFLDSGEAHSSVMLRYLSNRKTIREALARHRKAA